MLTKLDRLIALSANLDQHQGLPSRSIAETSADMIPRTYERWTSGKALKVDGRLGAVRPEPKNKLSEAERAAVISVMNRPEYASLPPSQVVPMLADDGVYIPSESTIYRILRENDQQHHRWRSKAPISREPVTHVATGSNQVWSWDIT